MLQNRQNRLGDINVRERGGHQRKHNDLKAEIRIVGHVGKIWD
jgi:hypothetical protein